MIYYYYLKDLNNWFDLGLFWDKLKFREVDEIY